MWSWSAQAPRFIFPRLGELPIGPIGSSEAAVKKLEAAGVTVRDPEATLQEIARENGSSPRKIYSYLTNETVQPRRAGGAITGIGRMTLPDLAEAMGLETDA